MNRPANSLRGEASLQVGNKDLLLRPSFENLVAAEEELGSLFALIERASDGELTLNEITALLWHCLAVDPRPERADVGSAVLAMGLVQATAPVRIILAEVLQGQS
ncbi:MAG: gene transfer agent family protein [Pseudomonadota bacterium]